MEITGTITDGTIIQDVHFLLVNNSADIEHFVGLILGAISALVFWIVVKDVI